MEHRYYYADQSAATLNPFGDGIVIYLGTIGDADYYTEIARWVLELAGIAPLLDAPVGVEVSERWKNDHRLLFVLNHTHSSRTIRLAGACIDLISGGRKMGTVELAPCSVLILTDGSGG